EQFVGLLDAGLYRFRKGAELHATSPEAVRRLHGHVRNGEVRNFSAFEELSASAEPIVVRDLLATQAQATVAIQEAASEDAILRKFSTQAMSLGSLSPEAHRTLALAMNSLGGRSNTGEGGEDPSLCETNPSATNKVKQVASGRFGVTADYLVHAEEIEIK